MTKRTDPSAQAAINTMQTTMPTTNNDALANLTDEDILAWLKGHPDFLKKNPDACEILLPPEEYKGRGVADFQTYMVERLKRDKANVIETARDLIEVSRINMNNISRIHEATLSLLEARHFTGFMQTLTTELPTRLDVDVTVLAIESRPALVPVALHTPGLVLVAPGTIEAWLGDNAARLESQIEGSEALYGGAARLVRSHAVLRIDLSGFNLPPCLVAFGSRDPEMFGQDQGIELVSYLTRVIERCLRLWLDQP